MNKFGSFIRVLGSAVALLGCTMSVNADNSTINLIPSSSTSDVYRVQTRLEGKGSVWHAAEQSNKLRLEAQFRYDERIIARKQSLKSIRLYDTARAEIRLDRGSLVNELDADHRLILTQASGSPGLFDVQIASVQGPLSQSEFDLINTPANTLVAAKLISKDQVEVGQKWQPQNGDLARFLNIDSIEQNNVELKLEKNEASLATIFVSGTLIGTIDGAKTEISVNGTLGFDTKRGQIRDLLLTINQQRDMGLLSPGLDAVFKIKSQLQPVSGNAQLSDAALSQMRKRNQRISDHLQLKSTSGQFLVIHPHTWRVIGNHDERATFRYIRNGLPLGQCDIMPLPRRAADQPQTINQLKKSVETNLAEHEAVITNSGQGVTQSGLDWIRVDAAGTAEGVTLHWSYYVLNHPDGRRLQLVLTTEPDNAAAFSGADQTMLNGIAFAEPAAKPAANASFKK